MNAVTGRASCLTCVLQPSTMQYQCRSVENFRQTSKPFLEESGDLEFQPRRGLSRRAVPLSNP
jgi:hypothetical protein